MLSAIFPRRTRTDAVATSVPDAGRSRPATLGAMAAVLVASLLVGAAGPVHATVPAVTSAAELVAQVMLAPAGIESLEERPNAAEARRSDRTAGQVGAGIDPDAVAVNLADEGEEPLVFASVEGTDLVLPGEVLAVGFHQGPSDGLPLVPSGELLRNLNQHREAPESSGTSDVPYYVLATRNRGTGPTTAVDISMAHGAPVTSPVDGTVKIVQDYALYGRTTDVLVEIVPDAQPDQVVRILHVEGVVVEEGETVEAGDPMADSARQLPFSSQIDRIAGAHPHVHIQVHRISSD